MLAVGSGKNALIKIGSWSLTDPTPQIGIDAAGFRTRTATLVSGSEPGRCGGESTVDRHKGHGLRHPPAEARRRARVQRPQGLHRGHPAPRQHGARVRHLHAGAPPLHHDSWDRFEGTLPKKVKDKTLFGKSKTLTFSFKDDWAESGYWVANGGYISTSAHMEWTLTPRCVKSSVSRPDRDRRGRAGVVLLAGVNTTLIDSLSDRTRRRSPRPVLLGLIVSLTWVADSAVALPLPSGDPLGGPALAVAGGRGTSRAPSGAGGERALPFLAARRETTVNRGAWGRVFVAGPPPPSPAARSRGAPTVTGFACVGGGTVAERSRTCS